MRDPGSATGHPRRLVVTGALGGLVLALAGCGIRLEDDAPRVPLVPEREPIAAEAALIRLLAAVQTAGLVPATLAKPVLPGLASLHQRQALVLHDALRQRGVPEDELPRLTAAPAASGTPSRTPSASSSPNPSTSPSPTAFPTTVAALETGVIDAGVGCHEADRDLRPTLLALLGQAHAVLDLAPAAATSTTTPPDATRAPWSSPTALVSMLTALRTATYQLEVAAARSPEPTRGLGLQGTVRLSAIASEIALAAGAAAPPADLGAALPFPVTTPAQAARLVSASFTGLLTALGSALSQVSDADAAVGFAQVPTWIGAVAAQAQRQGMPLTAFPGLA